MVFVVPRIPVKVKINEFARIFIFIILSYFTRAVFKSAFSIAMGYIKYKLSA